MKRVLYPLSPHDALKHHFTSLKTDLFFLQPRGFRMKISMKVVYQQGPTWHFSLIFQPLQVHYKSRIATAIRGL